MLGSLNTCSESRPSLSLSVFTIFIATAKSRSVSAGAEIRRANEEPEPTREKNTMTTSIVWASEPSYVRNQVTLLLWLVFWFQRTSERVIASVYPRPKIITRPCLSSSSMAAAAWATWGPITLIHFVWQAQAAVVCLHCCTSCPALSAFTDIYIVSRYTVHIYTYFFATSFPQTAVCLVKGLICSWNFGWFVLQLN